MKHKFIAIVLMLAVTATTHASVIRIETASSGAGTQVDGAAYKSAVESALTDASYQSADVASYHFLTHGSLFSGSHGNFAWKSTVTFNVATAGDWSFRSASDFGLGGAIFLDGQAYDTIRWDIYDPGYTNPSSYFDFSVADLTAGNHTLNVYGFENCCDGMQQAQYRIGNSGQFTSFSSTDGLDPARVPEPGTMALGGLGLGMLMLARRRKTPAAA